MEKIFFAVLLIFLVSACFADNYSLKNSILSLSFEKGEKNNIYISDIKDEKSGIHFIKEPLKDKSLWQISVKDAKDYAGPEIRLTGKDAESVKCENSTGKIVFTWKNVRSAEMTEGFDVVCSAELKGENSYWNMKVTSPKSYGLWWAKLILNDLDGQNGDQWMYPLRGNGYILTEFDNPKGIVNHGAVPGKEDYYVREIGYASPVALNINSFTKENSTLYISPEDKTFTMKRTHIQCWKPNHLDYLQTYFPADMGKVDYTYTIPAKLCVAMIKGDWYNAAKKYRKWGMNAKIPVFAQGKAETRKDMPQWLKDNVAWLRWITDTEDNYKNIISAQKFLGVPCGVHVYQWSEYPFDVHYPEWLPGKEIYTKHIKDVQAAGMHVMPYTNGHIIDRNNSFAFKKYGTEILASDCNGALFLEHWARDKGADNAVACMGSAYKDIIQKEFVNIIRETGTDALYIDQIGASNQPLCFNKNHNHSFGAGDDYIKTYRQFIKDIKKEMTEIHGEPVPVCTEDTSEALNFDMWLRVNDGFAGNTDTPLPNVVYSEYAMNICDNIEPPLAYYEFLKSQGKGQDYDIETIMNQMTATALVSGTQIGWHAGSRREFERYPNYGTYFRNAAQARYSAIKYFNFGEVMRKVSLSDVPTKEIFWTQWNGTERVTLPLVRTGTFRYKGKTMICFSNVSEKETEFSWSGKAEDMGLKVKPSYKLTEIYPEKSDNSVMLTGCIGSQKIGAFETKLYIIE